MATAYGTALGFDSTKLLLALLVTQIVAFPFAIIFGRLANCYKTERLITICIGAYLGIAIFAISLREQWQFWILAILVGMFQGGIQALSRSYFAKIIPPEKSGEYFGRMDICGKGASFLGTIVISLISQVTGKVKYRCRRDIRVLCTWDDRVPDGTHGGNGRRKESEDEIRGRWGILRGEEEIIL